jgi:hypothetical protein
MVNATEYWLRNTIALPVSKSSHNPLPPERQARVRLGSWRDELAVSKTGPQHPQVSGIHWYPQRLPGSAISGCEQMQQ